MGDTGLEQPHSFRGKIGPEGACGAESGAPDAVVAGGDPDLKKLIEAWPKLGRATRAGIIAMVRVAELT